MAKQSDEAHRERRLEVRRTCEGQVKDIHRWLDQMAIEAVVLERVAGGLRDDPNTRVMARILEAASVRLRDQVKFVRERAENVRGASSRL